MQLIYQFDGLSVHFIAGIADGNLMDECSSCWDVPASSYAGPTVNMYAGLRRMDSRSSPLIS